MASSSAPKHDFAPAWLKIPSNAQKPSGGASINDSSFRREEISSSINSVISLSHLKTKALSQQDQQQQQQHRDRGRSGFPYRHHSIDTDDLQHHSPHYSGGSVTPSGEYRLTSGQRQQSGSQPSLGRRSLNRQDYRDSSSPNNSLSGFKGLCSYENSTEPHRGSVGHWGRQRSFERNHGGGRNSRVAAPSSTSSASAATNVTPIEKEAPPKDGSAWQEDKKDKFDQEFPSLKGGKTEDETPAAKSVVNGSVWDTSKSGKIHLKSSGNKKITLVQKPIRNDIIKRSSSPGSASNNTSVSGSPKSIPHATILKQATKTMSNSCATSVYRTLTPVKPMIRRASKDIVKSNGQSAKSTTGSQSSITPPLILNTRLVTHPKNLGNKSDFLKELRDDGSLHPACDTNNKNEDVEDEDDDEIPSRGGVVMLETNDGSQQQQNCEDEGSVDFVDTAPLPVIEMQNGRENEQDLVNDRFRHSVLIENSSLVEDQELSRSLEAERRLLREMGWKEEESGDEGTYAPLTEDEMKEFEHRRKENPRRNGFQWKNQFTWSPKRVLTIPNALELENEISASSSTDSDSD